MSASLQRASRAAGSSNIISGGGGPRLWWGDKVDHDDRYARTSEFLDVLKGVWNGGRSTSTGASTGSRARGCRRRWPGSRSRRSIFSRLLHAAIEAAGRHADYYLSWLEPYEALAEKFAQVGRASDRAPKFAVRVDVLARETEEEAWEEIRAAGGGDARSVLRRAAPGRTTRTERRGATGDSIGWQRSRSFVTRGGQRLPRPGGRAERVARFHLLRRRPGLRAGRRTTEQVAERLDELLDLGVGRLHPARASPIWRRPTASARTSFHCCAARPRIDSPLLEGTSS